MLRLPEEMRPRLKRPLGQLFSDIDAAVERLRQLQPTMVIAVGDMVTAGLLTAGIKPDVAVIDFIVMRSPASEKIRQALESFKVDVVRVRNPPGTITKELREVLETARPPLKVIVEGEEDLAALPAVLSAPLGSVVIYGQPGEGLVIVEVTERKRREFEKLLKHFKLVNKPR